MASVVAMVAAGIVDVLSTGSTRCREPRDLGGGRLPGRVHISIVQKLDTEVWQWAELRLGMINLFDEFTRSATTPGSGRRKFGPRQTVLAGLTQRF